MLLSFTRVSPAWRIASQSLWGRVLAWNLKPKHSLKEHCIMPRRNRRGLNLIFVSVLMVAVVLSLNVYVQQMVRTERTIRAGEIATHLTNLAPGLDFWVHYNRTKVDTMLGENAAISIDASDMAHPINVAETFIARNRNNWDINYVILKIVGELHPFGVIVARPTSTASRSLSSLVQLKISQRTRSSQTGAPYSFDYLRDLLKPEGIALAPHDIAFFSYNFNGLNTDYVLRQAFAGIPASVMATDVTFMNTSAKKKVKYSVKNVKVADAKNTDAKNTEITKIVPPDPSPDSEDTDFGVGFYARKVAGATLNVTDLSVLGQVSGKNMTASVLNAEDLTVSGATSARTLTVSKPSTLNAVTVQNRFTATGVVTVQNNIALTGVINTDIAIVEKITSENLMTATTAKAGLLTSKGITVKGTFKTGSCRGC